MTVHELDRELGKQVDLISAGLIMQFVLKMNRTQIIINSQKELETYIVKKALRIAKKVKNGYPVQYAVKRAYFMYDYFYVNKNVLIPRPDTEVVVEKAIEIIQEMQEKNIGKRLKILDLCTGSGCIAISLAKKLNNVYIVGVDISNKALKVAKKNCKNIIKENTINTIYFFKSNMFKNIKEEQYDIIISNPPYIEKEVIKTLDIAVQKEPHIALDGGKDGLEFYKIIKQNVDRYLAKDGILILEIGYNQAKKVKEIFNGAECIKDLANNDRVIVWRKQ